LDGLSEALWYETKPLGINVCLVQPGFIKSKSFHKVHYSGQSGPENDMEGTYADYYKYMTPFIEKFMRLSFTTPNHVAKKILRIMKKKNPPLWNPATLDALLFYYLRRFIPRRILLQLLFISLPNIRLWALAYTNFKKK